MPDVLVRHLTTNAAVTNDAANMINTPYTGPIVNAQEIVNQLTVLRRDDLRASHWEMFLHTTTGNVIKVDLVAHFYRILYGAQVPTSANFTSEQLTINTPIRLGHIIQSVAIIANQVGAWSGTDDYNCQDFVLLFMDSIGMTAQQIFKYELRRRVTKHMPPAVTQSVNGVVQTAW